MLREVVKHPLVESVVQCEIDEVSTTFLQNLENQLIALCAITEGVQRLFIMAVVVFAV